MVHQIFGGIGAYLGAAVFDATGSYDIAFSMMLAVSLLALLLTLLLRQPRPVGQPRIAPFRKQSQELFWRYLHHRLKLGLPDRERKHVQGCFGQHRGT